jgi:hypothetical protein
VKVYNYGSYQEYVEEQTSHNIRKIGKGVVWVKENTIRQISSIHGPAKNIICHGTRSGEEQQFFLKQFPQAYVIGTEISPTASNYPNTTQWDFAEPKDEWLNKFDIVYSNSFDHSFDPHKTIDCWKDQLNENGALYVEWPIIPKHQKSTSMDPTGGSELELRLIFSEHKMKETNSFEIKNTAHPVLVIRYENM